MHSSDCYKTAKAIEDFASGKISIYKLADALDMSEDALLKWGVTNEICYVNGYASESLSFSTLQICILLLQTLRSRKPRPASAR